MKKMTYVKSQDTVGVVGSKTYYKWVGSYFWAIYCGKCERPVSECEC